MEENKRTELDKKMKKKEIMTPKDYRSIFGDHLRFRDHGLLIK